MKKIILIIGLLALAPNAISSERGNKAAIYTPAIPAIGVVGDEGKHDSNMFSIMTMNIPQAKQYYSQISRAMAATIPLLKEQKESKTVLLQVDNRSNLSNVMRYMLIRHDIRTNVEGAKQSMLNYWFHRAGGRSIYVCGYFFFGPLDEKGKWNNKSFGCL